MITTGSIPAALSGGLVPAGAGGLPAEPHHKRHRHRPVASPRSAFPEKLQAHRVPDMPAAYPVGAGGLGLPPTA